MVSTEDRIKHIYVPQSQVDSVPISSGQLIYTTDTLSVYWDISSTERKVISDVVILATETERESILAPLDKFYFVEETNEFWKYSIQDDDWIQLTNKKRTIDCGGP